MSTLKITRHSGPHITIDVPSEFADKARVYSPEQRRVFAQRLLDTTTLDLWFVRTVKPKRGLSNFGFVAHCELLTGGVG